MNPLSLHAENYRTFERLDIDLPSGCVAVVGANGSGKSSLLNAIDIALFAERGELTDLLKTGEDELVLQLTFEHAGDLYKVRRQYSGKGRGKAVLDFEKWDGEMSPAEWHPETLEQWRPLTRETAAATQEAISQCIGLKRRTFRASAFLRQDDAAAFSEADPSKRKEILSEILDLGLWKRLHDRARADIRQVEDEIVGLRERAAIAQETAAKRGEIEAAIIGARTVELFESGALATAEETLTKARDAIAETQAAVERAKRCESEHETAALAFAAAQNHVSEAKFAARQRAEKQGELNEAATLAERVEDLQVQVDELRSMKGKADLALAARAEAEREAKRLTDECLRQERDHVARREQAHALAEKATHLREAPDVTDECDRCGQHLGSEARARAVESYMNEAAEIMRALEAELPALNELRDAASLAECRPEEISVPEVVDPTPMEAALAQARAAAERRAALAVLVQGYAEKAAILPRLEADLEHAEAGAREKARALDEAREAVGDIGALRAAATAASEAVATARARLDETRARIAREQVELERCVAAEQELAEAVEAHRAADERLDLLKVAERAFGRDGIPALVVEASAIPQIELEANRILEAMPMSDGRVFRVELRTQRALKTAEHLRETLDIVIYVGSDARPYETFSGGERGRLNIALRVALAKLLAHRRGAESRVLAIDEIPYLDVLGQQQLVDVVNGLGQTFDRVYVVAHEAMLRDAFDRTIEVVTDGERSHVVGAEIEVAA